MNRAAAFASGLAIVASVSLFVVGCAVRKFPANYVPQQNVQRIKDADAVSVEVKVEDQQPDESLPLDYFNPISQRTPFRAKDPEGTIKGATEAELKARGFKIGTGGALVTIQLDRFDAECEATAFSASAHGYISMRVQVQSHTGKVLFSNEIKGEANPIYAHIVLRCATPELEGALKDVIKRLFSDPAFTTAILATRSPPSRRFKSRETFST